MFQIQNVTLFPSSDNGQVEVQKPQALLVYATEHYINVLKGRAEQQSVQLTVIYAAPVAADPGPVLTNLLSTDRQLHWQESEEIQVH